MDKDRTRNSQTGYTDFMLLMSSARQCRHLREGESEQKKYHTVVKVFQLFTHSTVIYQLPIIVYAQF